MKAGDFDSLSGGDFSLDSRGISWDREQLWKGRRGGREGRDSIMSVSIEWQSELLAPSLRLDAFTQPSQPITLSSWAVMKPG